MNEEAREHAYALKRAVSAISSEDLAYGYGSPNILVWADSEAELARRERAVIKLLQKDELVLQPEYENATKAWMGMTPGDAYSNVRNPPLSTRTCAFLLPHGAVWTGEPWDHHWKGPPLLTLSSNGQPFWWTLHQHGAASSTMILGPTQSGKSGLIGLIGMQALRYDDMQIFAWDRDYSLYCATKMAGGAHYQLGADGKGLQPLGNLDTEAQIRWRQEWVQDLLKAEGVPPTIDERQAIWDALVHLAAQPRRELSDQSLYPLSSGAPPETSRSLTARGDALSALMPRRIAFSWARSGRPSRWARCWSCRCMSVRWRSSICSMRLSAVLRVCRPS